VTNPAAGQPPIGDLVDEYISQDATRDVSGRPGKAVPLVTPDDDERQRQSSPAGQPPIRDLVDEYISQDATRDVSGRPGKAVPLVSPVVEAVGPVSPTASTGAPTGPPPLGDLVAERPRRWWLLIGVVLLAIGGIAGAVASLQGSHPHILPTTTTTTVPPTTTTTTVPPTTTTTPVPTTTTTTPVPTTTTTTPVPTTTTPGSQTAAVVNIGDGCVASFVPSGNLPLGSTVTFHNGPTSTIPVTIVITAPNGTETTITVPVGATSTSYALSQHGSYSLNFCDGLRSGTITVP
jgi:hypothetical protein